MTTVVSGSDVELTFNQPADDAAAEVLRALRVIGPARR